jgi:ketosteroid isomerase-like protein
MVVETSTIAESGDVALTSAHWTLDGTGPDGKPAHMEARSAEIARRQPNGEWLYVVDSAFGLG